MESEQLAGDHPFPIAVFWWGPWLEDDNAQTCRRFRGRRGRRRCESPARRIDAPGRIE
jgi:hypothetical protein